MLYTLRKEARFHDGSPMTPEDVVWTFDTLRAKGHPMYRSYYGDVTKVAQEGERGVRFHFKSADNRELPQILGEMPVLSKKYWSAAISPRRRSTRRSAAAPTRSTRSIPAARSPTSASPTTGAPTCRSTRAGTMSTRSATTIIATARSLSKPSRPGNTTSASENASKNWATGYDSPALRAGLIKKELIPNQLPSGMQGFGYNLRRPLFQDPRVRQALAYAFDFEWSNKNLFYGAYTRTRSYFDNSELAATGLPQGEELKILETIPRQDPRRGVHQGIRSAQLRWLRQRSATACARRSPC